MVTSGHVTNIAVMSLDLPFPKTPCMLHANFNALSSDQTRRPKKMKAFKVIILPYQQNYYHWW